MPQNYYLSQNNPNPFNPITQTRCGLPQDNHVKLTVYNILGTEIAVLVDGMQNAGNKTVEFSGTSMVGAALGELPSGVYFYRLSVVSATRRDLVPIDGRNGQAGIFMEIRKMIFLR